MVHGKSGASGHREGKGEERARKGASNAVLAGDRKEVTDDMYASAPVANAD